MYICVDFDGTCVTHEFPRVGSDVGAQVVLRELVKSGHKLILFTMRSDFDGNGSPEFPEESGGTYLTDAVNWFKSNDIPLFGINVNPTQTDWTSSPKAYGNLYIDDAALGVALVYGVHDRPYVDWLAVGKMLCESGVITSL